MKTCNYKAPDEKRRWYVALNGKNVTKAIQLLGIPKWRSLVSAEHAYDIEAQKDFAVKDFATLLFETEVEQINFRSYLLLNNIDSYGGRGDAFDWYLYDHKYWEGLCLQ